jgi:hypothetical membrane protein
VIRVICTPPYVIFLRTMSLLRALRYFGVIALSVGWITIILAISVNPWFSLARNALSDLGAIGRENAWIFNSGLILAGIIAALYSIYLIASSRGKLEILASTIFLMSSIHLILIGAFPEGTYPHLFVSYWFFLSAGLAVLLFGAAMLVKRDLALGTSLVIISVIGFAGAALIPWPSIGAVEVFAIILLSIWAMLMLRRF